MLAFSVVFYFDHINELKKNWLTMKWFSLIGFVFRIENWFMVFHENNTFILSIKSNFSEEKTGFKVFKIDIFPEFFLDNSFFWCTI